MIRTVVDKETLSGHGAGGDYPEIIVLEPTPPEQEYNGPMMFTIQCFHNAQVAIKENGETDLTFENKTRVTVSYGTVMYAEAETTETASS